MSDVLRQHRHDHVLVLEMNHPERHHALNFELGRALAEALDVAESAGDVRVVVLTGSGEKAFCAGQDMLEASGVEPRDADAGKTSAYIAIDRVRQARLPVIAAINGYCYGGGAALAIACDLRIAGNTATFRLPGAEYGLVVGAASLPRLVGAARAKELILTARKFDAEDAFRWGLLNEVTEPAEVLDKALGLAQEIAGHSPVAVQESKRVIDMATLDAEAFEAEDEINLELRGSEDQSARFRAATRRVTGR